MGQTHPVKFSPPVGPTALIHIKMAQCCPDWQQNLLVDPQTNGGLLVSCDPADADPMLRLFRDRGYPDAGVIGAMEEGAVGVSVH